MEKTVNKININEEDKKDLEFRKSKTPEERLSAVQILREQYSKKETRVPPRRIKN